jgi:hypothetical protein
MTMMKTARIMVAPVRLLASALDERGCSAAAPRWERRYVISGGLRFGESEGCAQ